MRELADALHRVADEAGRVRALEAELEERRRAGRRDLLAALSAARDAGASLRQLGDAAGLSRQRVAQLLAER